MFYLVHDSMLIAWDHGMGNSYGTYNTTSHEDLDHEGRTVAIAEHLYTLALYCVPLDL